MSDEPRPTCIKCGSRDVEGPYGNVWFCNGCGRTVRAGETLEEVHQRERAERERKKQKRG